MTIICRPPSVTGNPCQHSFVLLFTCSDRALPPPNWSTIFLPATLPSYPTVSYGPFRCDNRPVPSLCTSLKLPPALIPHSFSLDVEASYPITHHLRSSASGGCTPPSLLSAYLQSLHPAAPPSPCCVPTVEGSTTSLPLSIHTHQGSAYPLSSLQTLSPRRLLTMPISCISKLTASCACVPMLPQARSHPLPRLRDLPLVPLLVHCCCPAVSVRTSASASLLMMRLLAAPA